MLANSWDVMSTRIAEQNSVIEIVTTSTGISWRLGYPDNQLANRKIIMKVLDLIISSTDLPVTANIKDSLLSDS
ncbi:Putative Carboxyvinyl-carboxyphosphonate phosphorylmutase (fragment) [Xenorhabdus szentirmaii DSM 16338]|uniref:Carboxyvinyl-carboxyphosphonate phosphorylmutase n=1 Tax=Xenorhabdus szentirmaii DSM 16338 TaxID=1427518 RepID=W1IVS5_9GAMM